MISERPDFGSNRSNRGPISAASRPIRLKPLLSAQKRGTAKAVRAKIGVAADVLICPDFFKKSGFLKKNLAIRS